MGFKNIGIAGIGLLGGSIAIRSKQVFGNSVKIIGFSRSPDKLKTLPQSVVFDDLLSYQEISSVSQCDLVIICTPVLSIPKIFKLMNPFLNKNAIVTDTGSTKYEIIKEISNPMFVGSHPMAGGEKVGFENSDPSILIGVTCAVTPYNNTDEQVNEVSEFWGNLGMNVIKLSPEIHDEISAKTSHSIHVISFLISFTLSKTKFSEEKFFNIYGKGLLDTTRISKSDPKMWYDIIATNRENIKNSLKEFKKYFEYFENALDENKLEELKSIMTEAKNFREKLE